MMSRVLGNTPCDLDPKVKVKGQIMYFLVNASSPKPLDIATSNFSQVHRSTDIEGTGQHFVGSRSNNIISCKCIFS